MTNNASTKNVNEELLAAILDRLIPAIDDVPSAGNMGLTTEIVRLSGQQARFQGIFKNAMEIFESTNSEFVLLDSEAQVTAIRKFESNEPDLFSSLLTISYIVYYKDARVHKRIGWSGRTPQPEGNPMEPWDDSILETQREREPFWRKV
ncbi:MAG: hypothetical protein HN926_05270 [Chloroflexi bacterium]|nr:hypothetical protein [Chloroflexota bacterium]MBT3862232.1 hypothetical protein [Chloroflexota bacterium]MBT4142536.1 hypothetical protein [Chloroflexota bacterium]MBT5252708.1 hypothetical protein [Chloroflexota bacterium]MBT5476535.1 hypothetical protein [Chloroflexota bacterium]